VAGYNEPRQESRRKPTGSSRRDRVRDVRKFWSRSGGLTSCWPRDRARAPNGEGPGNSGGYGIRAGRLSARAGHSNPASWRSGATQTLGDPKLAAFDPDGLPTVRTTTGAPSARTGSSITASLPTRSAAHRHAATSYTNSWSANAPLPKRAQRPAGRRLRRPDRQPARLTCDCAPERKWAPLHCPPVRIVAKRNSGPGVPRHQTGPHWAGPIWPLKLVLRTPAG
jgi:hypothetical protein